METTLMASFPEAFETCKNIVTRLGMTIDHQNEDKGLIQVSVSGSLLSWGESIEILFKSVNKYSTKVKVISEAKAQLVSWGKNSANEQAIINELHKKFGNR